MYVNFHQKWEQNSEVDVVESMEAKPFYDRQNKPGILMRCLRNSAFHQNEGTPLETL